MGEPAWTAQSWKMPGGRELVRMPVQLVSDGLRGRPQEACETRNVQHETMLAHVGYLLDSHCVERCGHKRSQVARAFLRRACPSPASPVGPTTGVRDPKPPARGHRHAGGVGGSVLLLPCESAPQSRMGDYGVGPGRAGQLRPRAGMAQGPGGVTEPGRCKPREDPVRFQQGCYRCAEGFSWAGTPVSRHGWPRLQRGVPVNATAPQRIPDREAPEPHLSGHDK